MDNPNADVVAVAHVMNAGKELFGEHWVTPLAAQLNVNERTMRRIAAAARDRTGYPAARALQSLMVANHMNQQRSAMGLGPAMCMTIAMEDVRKIERRPQHLTT